MRNASLTEKSLRRAPPAQIVSDVRTCSWSSGRCWQRGSIRTDTGVPGGADFMLGESLEIARVDANFVVGYRRRNYAFERFPVAAPVECAFIEEVACPVFVQPRSPYQMLKDGQTVYHRTHARRPLYGRLLICSAPARSSAVPTAPVRSGLPITYKRQ